MDERTWYLTIDTIWDCKGMNGSLIFVCWAILFIIVRL
jgi:hypothetical protein